MVFFRSLLMVTTLPTFSKCLALKYMDAHSDHTEILRSFMEEATW